MHWLILFTTSVVFAQKYKFSLYLIHYNRNSVKHQTILVTHTVVVKRVECIPKRNWRTQRYSKWSDYLINVETHQKKIYLCEFQPSMAKLQSVARARTIIQQNCKLGVKIGQCLWCSNR